MHSSVGHQFLRSRLTILHFWLDIAHGGFTLQELPDHIHLQHPIGLLGWRRLSWVVLSTLSPRRQTFLLFRHVLLFHVMQIPYRPNPRTRIYRVVNRWDGQGTRPGRLDRHIRINTPMLLYNRYDTSWMNTTSRGTTKGGTPIVNSQASSMQGRRMNKAKLWFNQECRQTCKKWLLQHPPQNDEFTKTEWQDIVLRFG